MKVATYFHVMPRFRVHCVLFPHPLYTSMLLFLDMELYLYNHFLIYTILFNRTQEYIQFLNLCHFTSHFNTIV
jgi:hypothetical protein